MIDKNLAVGLTAICGGLSATQAPINSTLGKRVVTAPRIVGIALLAAGTFLVVKY